MDVLRGWCFPPQVSAWTSWTSVVVVFLEELGVSPESVPPQCRAAEWVKSLRNIHCDAKVKALRCCHVRVTCTLSCLHAEGESQASA